jgi:hypothetical protein
MTVLHFTRSEILTVVQFHAVWSSKKHSMNLKTLKNVRTDSGDSNSIPAFVRKLFQNSGLMGIDAVT